MSQHILRLVSENVKRIRAVDLVFDPARSLWVISGKNEQGKTSLLDTISLILGGKRIQPPKTIREGETYARALLETEDLIVERKWKSNTDSTVEVRSKDGTQKFRSPQAMLDALTTRSSFDPLSFLKLKPDEQVAIVAKLAGIDFRQLEGRRLKFFDDRTVVNRELAGLQERLKALPVEAAPLQRVDVVALLEQQRKLQADATAHREAQGRVDQANAAIDRAAEEIRIAEATLASGYVKRKAAIEAKGVALQLVGNHPTPDAKILDELTTRIATASDHNERARKQADRNELAEKVSATEEQAAALTKSIDGIDEEKERLVAAAKFPVAGLGFDATGVTYKGFPLEQASGAGKIRISTAIGFAINPELRVLRIDDGDKLDPENMKLLADLAHEMDGQIFVETVRASDGMCIVIEDGSVLSIDGQKVA